jgi:transcriptional regulator with XRE-family HTH domain
MDDLAAPFWERVNQLIKTQKTTQEDLAKSLDIPFGTYRGWNAYKRLPDVSSGHKIAQALNTSVEYLVSGKEPENSKSAVINAMQAVIDQHR